MLFVVVDLACPLMQELCRF